MKTDVAIAAELTPIAVATIDVYEKAAQEPNSTIRTDIWPGWRGANGQGIAPKSSPPIEFGPEKSVRWKTEMPGSGHSCPCVWEKKLFLTTDIDGTLFVLCYDRDNGNLLWKKEVGPAKGGSHGDNGHATATPVTDGKYVITFFGATGLFCHDFDGNELWKVNLGEIKHYYGFAASPIIYENLVIQLADNQEHSFMIACDVATGKEVWRTDRAGLGGWATPVIISAQLPDGTVRDEMLINGDCSNVMTKGVFRVYDPKTGQEWWSWPGTIGWGIPTPLVSDGLVYLQTGLSGRTVVMKPGGAGDVTGTEQVVWNKGNASAYVPSGIIYRNRVYIQNDSMKFYSLNIGNGEKMFEKKNPATYYASPVAADGRIYTFSREGKVYVYEANDGGKLLAENDLGAGCTASPAIVGDDLIVRTETTLFCFGK